MQLRTQNDKFIQVLAFIASTLQALRESVSKISAIGEEIKYYREISLNIDDFKQT